MKLNARTIAVLASVAFAVASVSAQSMPSSPYLSVPQRSTFLLANPFEIKKLDLSATEFQAVAKALATYRTKQTNLLKLKDPSEKDQETIDKAYANGCLKILTTAQAEKLLSIGIKQIGTEALKDPGICAKIGLSSGQIHKIADIAAAYNKRAEDVDAMVGDAMEKIPQPKAGADRKAYDKQALDVYNSYAGERMRLQREKAEADKKILAVMTPAQQTNWTALAGKSAENAAKH